MWERSSQIWEWHTVCDPCRKLGQKRHKTDEPVCLESGGACVREAKLPPLPIVPLTARATRALRLFFECSTQWRTSFGGLTGLDYPSCRMVAKNIGIEWNDTFPLLRVLEASRLRYANEEIEKKREQEAAKRK